MTRSTALAAALVAAGVISGFAASPAHALDRALVIGINSYPQLVENGAKADRDLEVAVADAERFSAFLTEDWGMDPSGIRMLTDADATRANVLANFEEWLIEGTEPGDRVVFYYSGHGFQSVDEDGDEGDDPFDEGIAPHDTAGDVTTGEFENVIIDDEIAKLIERLDGREIWVVVDACFSGTITRSVGLPEDGRLENARARTLTPRGPRRASTRSLLEDKSVLARHKARTRLLSVVEDTSTKKETDTELFAWSATSSAQLAFERTDLGGGVFTTSFIEGLKDKAADFDGDGQVTAAELLTFVRKRSDDFCKSEPQCSNGSGLTPEVIAPDEHFAHVLAPPLFSNLNSDKTKDEAQNEDKTEAKPNKTADALFGHDNDFAISLSLEPGTSPALGQEVKIKVGSAEKGHLVVFDQSPDGSLRQVFPNDFSKTQSKDGLITAGGALTIPDPSYGFAFEVTEPGESVLLALVIDSAVDFGPLLAENGDFDIIKDPDGFLTKVAAKLHGPKVTDDDYTQIDRHRWAYASMTYTVK